MVPTPTISVLMPVYQAAGTLSEAIASVQAQSEAAWELIAVDDGSTDQSPEILQQAAAEDPRIQLVRAEHRGIVAALQRGLEACRGPWIARFDADDRMLPGRLEAQLEKARASGAAVVGGKVRIFPQASAGMARYVDWINRLQSHEEIERELFVESPLVHPASLIEARLLRSLGGYREGDFPEDYELWLRIYENGGRFAALDEYVLDWRQSPGRLTFREPRYRPEAFLRLKVEALLRSRLQGKSRIIIAGAGRDGRRLGRALAEQGRRLAFWLDVDPNKIGRLRQGAPVLNYDDLPKHWQEGDYVLVAVPVPGVRDKIRAAFENYGLREIEDYCAVA